MSVGATGIRTGIGTGIGITRRARARAGVAVILALLTVALAACSSSPSRPAASAAPAGAGSLVTIPGSEVRTIVSKETGTGYDLDISYPDGYSAGASTKYPVVYLLDAQWDFKLMRSVYENEVYDRTVPPLIIVGVTYSGASPDYQSLRAHDLTPTDDPDVPGSGGAPAFLRFLKSELIPYVESHLPADPARRYLMGSSFGGLFGLYTMLTEPALFAGYVCSSPAVTFGSGAIYQADAAFARTKRPLPVRLWVSVGTAEPLLAPVRRFLQFFEDRHYAGLTLQTRELEGETHSAGRVEAFNRGLRFLFAS